jgi:membrane protease YdiL (CAAX protease family)
MVAGLGEEILFRLIMLPLVYFALAKRTSRTNAAIAATIATGLAFALLHALGPHAGPPSWFVTRFLIPGCAMSVAAFLFRTTFVVTAHATAHVLIPFVFSSVT